MKTGRAIALGFLIALLGTGAGLLTSSPPGGNSISLLPPPTPLPIQVTISGEVNQPGVYVLPAESRVQDALAAAGGPTDLGDLQNLNLAALQQDDSHVRIFAQSQSVPPVEITENSQIGRPLQTTNPDARIELAINIDPPSQAELGATPGIGPVTAEKIITHRQENSAFTRIEEIRKVSDSGPVTCAKIKDLITVDETQ